MATLILRPNGNYFIRLGFEGGSTNYDCVDDLGGGDGDTTFVYAYEVNAWTEDRYHIQDPPSGIVGIINFVRVYIRHKRVDSNATGARGRTVLQVDSSIYYGAIHDPGTSYTLTYTQYNTNPVTGQAWTWSQITGLAAGYSCISHVLYDGYGNIVGYSLPRCTQVYVEVDYIPAAAVIENIRCFNAVTSTYQTTPPNVPLGSLVGCLATMRNTGVGNQSMYMKFILKRSDGSIRSVFDPVNNKVTLAPNATYDQGWIDYADQAGTWTMTIELYGEAL